MDKFMKPIRTDAEYDAAIAEVEQYFINEPAPGTPEADRLEMLATLIEAYDAEHYPIGPPDPIEVSEIGSELRIDETRRSLGGALEKFAKFGPDFMVDRDQEQIEREG
jgi:antitoxin component HigA of HigAB toxin-antitoxin module